MLEASAGYHGRVLLPVEGGGAFSVRRVYCVVGNYADHAQEMALDVDVEMPSFFMKPADSVLFDGSAIPYPPMTRDYQHEVELVVAIGRPGRDIPVVEAQEHIYGYAVGLDMTRRDLQFAARDRRGPWDMGKGADSSAPCGDILPASSCSAPAAAAVRLKVNGILRQSSTTAKLTWSVEHIIHWLSRYVRLEAGDLIFTGSPEGVSTVAPGDLLEASIEGLPELRVAVQ